METSNNKPTISDLCTALSLYNQTMGVIMGVPHTIPAHVTERVKCLHMMIEGIDQKEILGWFNGFDFINVSPIGLVKNTIAALGEFLDITWNKKHIAKRIDPDINRVRIWCKNTKTWLEEQLPILEERSREIIAKTPTDLELEWLEDLKQMPVDEWLAEGINSLSAEYKKRIILLALNDKNLDEQKRNRLKKEIAHDDSAMVHQEHGNTTKDETISVTRTRVKRAKKFSDLIQHPQKDELLKRLHFLIDGKRGAAVGAVLLKAQQKGYLTECPTQEEYESEFVLVGTWQAIHNYMNPGNSNALVKANKIIIFQE